MGIKKIDDAELKIGDKVYKLPMIKGTEGETAIDISNLRAESGAITLDYGYKNSGSCTSAITYLDGEDGILRYRGYPVEELAEHYRFVDVAYLLVHNRLPSPEDSTKFSALLNEHSLIHEDMRHFFSYYPDHAHPMGILSAMVVSLSSFYPELGQGCPEEAIDMATTRLLSKIRTLAAFSYKKTIGEPIVYPNPELKYCENFLNMMFSSPVKKYELNPVVVKALNVLFILHADHEQNCSTSAVRLVGSAKVNLYAAISAGICALWGPLHGGANQAVLEMLEKIHRSGGNVKKCMEMAKDKKSKFRLMGFGHRVYKTYDPRAKIIKKVCMEVLEELDVKDPLLDIALELEEIAMKDEYFVKRNLYPNVDFYSGIIYRAIGIPTSMFTVMFALGRLPGWIAQWRESMRDPEFKIQRPRQIYTGPKMRHVPAIKKKK